MDIIDLSQLIKFAAALCFVLALMGGLAVILKKFGNNHPLVSPQKRRLKILEVMTLDARRKAVLLRRDEKEHLVILGANSETVIETGIESPQDSDHAEKHND